MRYLVIALLMYGCGPTPAFGDDFSTSDIRTMWQGCYQEVCPVIKVDTSFTDGMV